MLSDSRRTIHSLGTAYPCRALPCQREKISDICNGGCPKTWSTKLQKVLGKKQKVAERHLRLEPKVFRRWTRLQCLSGNTDSVVCVCVLACISVQAKQMQTVSICWHQKIRERLLLSSFVIGFRLMPFLCYHNERNESHNTTTYTTKLTTFISVLAIQHGRGGMSSQSF